MNHSLLCTLFVLSFLKFYKFILFLVVLGLHWCTQSFSSWKGVQTRDYGDFFCRRAWAVGYVGFSSWGAWV